MSTARPLSLYVYYRAGPGAIAVLLPKLRRVQQAVAQQFGVTTKLMRRREDETLMEVYEGVRDPDALLEHLDAALAGIGFEAHLLPGSERHVERFECA